MYRNSYKLYICILIKTSHNISRDLSEEKREGQRELKKNAEEKEVDIKEKSKASHIFVDQPPHDIYFQTSLTITFHKLSHWMICPELPVKLRKRPPGGLKH